MTDLGRAIAQAAEFTTYRHADSGYSRLDERLQAYWKHILEQLTALKKKKTIMETGFFSRLMALNAAGDWKLTVARDKEDRIVVSALLYNKTNGDNAAGIIPPILLKGMPAEIDDGFFEAIGAPVTETTGLFINMEQHLKQRERAKAESQMEKDKQAKAEKEKPEKQKRYDEAMKKADEMEKEGRYRDAWVKVPDPADYPDKADELRKRKSELSAKFSPDLFNK